MYTKKSFPRLYPHASQFYLSEPRTISHQSLVNCNVACGIALYFICDQTLSPKYCFDKMYVKAHNYITLHVCGISRCVFKTQSFVVKLVCILTNLLQSDSLNPLHNSTSIRDIKYQYRSNWFIRFAYFQRVLRI